MLFRGILHLTFSNYFTNSFPVGAIDMFLVFLFLFNIVSFQYFFCYYILLTKNVCFNVNLRGISMFLESLCLLFLLQFFSTYRLQRMFVSMSIFKVSQCFLNPCVFCFYYSSFLIGLTNQKMFNVKLLTSNVQFVQSN